MDRLEAMTILVAVVETGSFTAAGRKLGIPLPTVSRKLAELEAHLGTRLLTRSTRRLALTETGADYVAGCKRILEEIGDIERKASGEYAVPKGELVVTAPVVFGRLHVLPIVSEFLLTYPDVDVRLLLSDRNAHLLDDHIDLAVRIGILPDSSMMATQVGTVRKVVCGSPSYLAKYGTPTKPDEVSGLPCVTFDVLSSVTSWSFIDGGDQGLRAVSVRSRLSVNTAEAALDAAVAGVGLTRVLSYQAAGALEDGKLQVVLDAFEPPPIPVSLIYAAQGPLPRKVRTFLDFAAPRLRARLPSKKAP
ncbi:LysR substrate-binding domain-containing protein [Methylobacterium nodulans]|uniref:Transcriptional regulator, LysR family n=1 Tax=Methylobacterium nodulans (strain LMG 21967 / CNCM I-2342 / ORS 2060) TaxID=460265 RepID=B8IC32_METNO|nr:LysR substrate-binding domain-containing protein [Methylobacterium nodulans]ACL61214.1 transcriptional regulator, LysR family [Methylobacterium nodulans ORS 2060]